MIDKIQLPADDAIWSGNTLVYDSWNEFRKGDPHERQEFNIGIYDGPFCYWSAVDGKCMALVSTGKSICIASVESALREAGARSVYVIWQPKDHGAAAWARWSKKWIARTASDTV